MTNNQIIDEIVTLQARSEVTLEMLSEILALLKNKDFETIDQNIHKRVQKYRSERFAKLGFTIEPDENGEGANQE
jgi:hypothetical protein